MNSLRPALLAIGLALMTTRCTLQRWQPQQGTSADDHMAHMSTADTEAPAVSMDVVHSQGTMGIPASAATTAARLKASTRHGEWVKLAWAPGSEDSLMAWTVYPDRRGKAPVVVVVHEIFGLQSWVRAVADQLAADGFVAIAPDLLSRVRGGPSTSELSTDSARKLIAGVDFAERNLGISAAAAYATHLPSAERRYGVVGFCWGGSTSFGHAVFNGRGLAAAVAFYGAPFMDGPAPIADSLAKIRVPMMLLNGANDARIGQAIPAIESTMKALGKDFSWKNYQGAVHGFMRAQDDASIPPDPVTAAANLEAAMDAWPRTIAFLRKNLRAD